MDSGRARAYQARSGRDLYLLRGVRLAWEDRHPRLRAAAAA